MSAWPRAALGFLLCFSGACTCESPERTRTDAGRDGAVGLDAPLAFPDAIALDGLAALDDAAGGDAPWLDGPGPDAPGLDAPPTARDAPTGDSPADVAIAPDTGCAPGTSRACDIACGMGTTAPGRQVCLGSGTWSPCERASEMCGNAMDDDADGAVDEGCREEGGCVWIRASCQGLGTLNEWCARAGGRRLVEGRRCPVAGGSTVPLDSAYGEFQLACCDVASMCRPECVGELCASSVVWDEIRCCP